MTIVRLQPAPGAEAVIARQRQGSRAFLPALRLVLLRWLGDVETHLRADYLRGGSPGAARRGGLPLAVRSGALLGSVQRDMDGPTSGWVGVIQGPAAAYARTQLGPDETVMRPRRARHLWIPVGDNLTASGQMRMSPRQAMDLRGPDGGRLLRIFRSRKGNLVAFLPEFREASRLSDRSRIGAATGRRYARGANQGRTRGRLLFVLKDEVRVQGSDALAKAAQDRLDDLRESLRQLVRSTLGGEG